MKLALSILLCFLVSFLHAQEEKTDLSFVKRNYAKDRKVTFLLTVQSGISVLSGGDAKEYRDYIEQVKQTYGYDKLKIAVQPRFSIGLAPLFSISKRIEIGIGLQYQYLGWRELFKYRPAPGYELNIRSNIYFHNVGIPLFLKINAIDNMGFRFGVQPIFLVKGQVIDKEEEITPLNTEKKTRRMTIEEAFQLEPQPVNLLLTMALDIGLTDHTSFTIGTSATMRSLFKREIQFSVITFDAGIVQKF